MQPRQQQFSLWYFLAAFAVLMALQATLFAPHTANLAYSFLKNPARYRRLGGKIPKGVLLAGAPFFSLSGSPPRAPYSEETSRAIDREVQALLAAAHVRVRETLTAGRATLEALAALLIEREVVDREALARLLASPQAERAAYNGI